MFDSDLCAFDDRCFIRCVLEVPYRERTGEFRWGVWAEVDALVFKRYLALYEVDGSSESLHPGILANAIPAYPQDVAAKVMLRFRESSKRPALYLAAEECGLLAKEQKEGISNSRYQEILHIIS